MGGVIWTRLLQKRMQSLFLFSPFPQRPLGSYYFRSLGWSPIAYLLARLTIQKGSALHYFRSLGWSPIAYLLARSTIQRGTASRLHRKRLVLKFPIIVLTEGTAVHRLCMRDNMLICVCWCGVIRSLARSSYAESERRSFCSNVVADWSILWTFWDANTVRESRDTYSIAYERSKT